MGTPIGGSKLKEENDLESITAALNDELTFLVAWTNQTGPIEQKLTALVYSASRAMEKLSESVSPVSLETIEKLRMAASSRLDNAAYQRWLEELYPRLLRGRKPLEEE